MSRPPPPDRIDGVDAIATIANGASVASSAGQFDGIPKFGSATMLAISSAIASSAANVQGRVRTLSAKEGADHGLTGELFARQLLG